MRKLEFTGVVRSNTGKFHKEMVVPGREALASAPDDWPDQLATGTLNVGIDPNNYPEDFAEIGTSKGMKRFDEGRFKPAFVIAHDEIIGNTLPPKPGQPRRGTSQVWRAELTVISTGERAMCWMLRRIGSRIPSQIELIAERRLRKQLPLVDDTPVKVTIFEG